MNLTSTERRTRVKKPISLIIISLILILSPIYNLSLQLYIRNLPISFQSLSTVRFNTLEICFILLPVVCGIGLYLIKKWAWYLFILYSLVLIIFNAYISFKYPVKFNLYSLTESIFIFLIAAYFLKKDMSAPYLKMYPRGWRGEKRKPVQVAVSINGATKTTKDISEAGFYVDWKEVPFEINEEVQVQMELNQEKKIFRAGTVRKDENGVGFAFRGLSDLDDKWIDNLIQMNS